MSTPTLYEWAGGHDAIRRLMPGAEVFAHAPVPRWGWGESPPFEP